jgi:hypothetical protein
MFRQAIEFRDAFIVRKTLKNAAVQSVIYDCKLLIYSEHDHRIAVLYEYPVS